MIHSFVEMQYYPCFTVLALMRKVNLHVSKIYYPLELEGYYPNISSKSGHVPNLWRFSRLRGHVHIMSAYFLSFRTTPPYFWNYSTLDPRNFPSCCPILVNPPSPSMWTSFLGGPSLFLPPPLRYCPNEHSFPK